MTVHFGERQSLMPSGLDCLRRRWKLVAACVVFSTVLGLLFALLRPVNYTASTQLLIYVKEVQPGPDLVIFLGRADLTQVENEIEIIRSRGTLTKVAQSLKLSEDPEFVPPATSLQSIAQWLFGAPSATSDESRNRQELAVDALAKRIELKRIGTSHTILVNVTTSDPEKSERIANGISQVMLQARVSADQDGSRSPLLRERLQGLGPSVYVMTRALAPDRPSGPRKLLVLLGAFIVGLVAGSMLALLLDFKDKTIRTAAQVEDFGLECIGAIPLLKCGASAASRSPRSTKEQGREDPFLPVPLLNQTLLRMTVAIEASKARVVGIASSVANEGATTVARQLAHMTARSQRRVLLVEPDRNETPRALAQAPSPGGVPVSETNERPRDGTRRSNRASGPDVLVTAAWDSIEAPANGWMHSNQKFSADYDLIIVSLPPLERGAEFRMAAQDLDGILLVIRWGKTEMEQVQRAFAVSGAMPSDFIGAVLNMMDDRMIGQFGDKLWEAEAATTIRRGLFGLAMPAEPVAGQS